MEKDYDLEAVYDAEIAPLMDKIMEVCKAHKMPMFATFVYKHDAEDDEDFLCTTNLPFEDDRETGDAFDSLYRTVFPKRNPTLRLTTRDKDGNVTNQTVILP